jgi:hypothetical protein
LLPAANKGLSMLTVVVCLVLALSFSLAVALLIQRVESSSEQDSDPR